MFLFLTVPGYFTNSGAPCSHDAPAWEEYHGDDYQPPHIHVKYQNDEVVVSIPDGDVLDGSILPSKMKLLQAWIELHKDGADGGLGTHRDRATAVQD